MVPIIFGVTLITFLIFNVVGGNPVYQFAGKNASAEEIRVLEKELGLDRSLPAQYVTYVKQIVTFDFGRSWGTRQKISTMIKNGLGASLSLSVPAFILGVLLSITISLLLAFFKGRFIDKFFMVFCLGMMSISYLVYIIFFQYFFGYYLDLFPISGFDSDWIGRWEYLILPITIMVIVSQGAAILLYRTIIIDEVYQDYVRTAKAKGLGDRIIYFRHVLKNAMIPIITVVVLEIPFLYTGSFLMEQFFSIPGLGNMMVTALQSADFPVIKAMTFIGSFLYIVFNLISDLLYSVVDPRVKLS